ncbi:MAG TPA: hypothetical protein VGK46_08310, partial [Saprospiraceae bacterium]
LWSAFMSNPEIAPALESIGFVEDPVSTNEFSPNALYIKVYPTMTKGDLYISWPEDIPGRSIQFSISDISGRKIVFHEMQVVDGLARIQFDQNGGIQGWYWVSIIIENRVVQSIPIWAD